MLTIPMWTSPLAMACDLNPKMVRTPALEIINRELWRAFNQPDSRLLISMPPQEGKTSILRYFLLWALWQRRSTRLMYVSFDLGIARASSRFARDEIVSHPELGLSVRDDVSAQQEWQLPEGGGVYAVGIGGPATGRPADMLIIDDPHKGRAEAESKVYRTAAYEWWTGTGSARLAPGAPVIVVGTRWHQDDLIGWLQRQEDGDRWKVVNIPAQADHNPSKGEADLLGREPGQFMVSARGRTQRQWQERKVTAGSRDWAALYQGRPSPAEGTILKREHWRYYELPLAYPRRDGAMIVPEVDAMLITLDCAFKDHEDSDYVAAQVWMRRGPSIFLLDQVHGQMDFTETCQRFGALCAKWPQASLKVVEDAANGPAVIATMRRVVAGIVGEIPQGSKTARAHATTPFLEAGNIHIPAPTMTDVDGSSFAWVGDFVEECAGFPNAAHDDRVDCYSMAVNRLLIQPLDLDTDQTPIDLEQELADAEGWTISPY